MQPTPAAPWIYRFAVKAFTMLLAVLLFWLLGFLVNDIGSIRGPDYAAIEKQMIDASAVARQATLERDLATVGRTIARLREKQQVLAAGTQGLERTMQQILELQKLSIEKELTVSTEQTAAFQESMEAFLANQKSYQTLNDEVAIEVDNQSRLQEQLRLAGEELARQRQPVNTEFQRLWKGHNNRLAAYKLLLLIPLFFAGGFLVLRRRGHAYFPLFLAFAGAVSCKMALVIHEHFPSRYFKYIVLVACLAAATRILVFFIRSIAAPRSDRLIRQYREAYERFLCPICEHPIRRGPMRFLYWNRRSIRKLSASASTALCAGGGESADDARYICPSCSTLLFEECHECQRTRHALLPYCEHCGAASAVVGAAAAQQGGPGGGPA